MRSGFIDIAGAVVNHLRVVGLHGARGKDTTWLCSCECGKTVIYTGRRLRHGSVLSCGCVPMPGPANKTHGEGGRSKNASVEYAIWNGIKIRTSHTNRKDSANYALRGIGMDAEWRASYEKFLAAVGRRPSPQHSLGRIDNDLGYVPGNVRWETLEEQANNKRTSRFIEAAGVRLTVAQWAKRLGVNDKSLYWMNDERLREHIENLSQEVAA